ncbi:MAG: hypothetical protein H7A23_18350 [Leptospiraceae bacterium]|nr:hypothetical protein [Leptospiraceae bacterium]MCP5496512.1 hypothetical protein [Leptospiraceae bacterium]
MDHKLQLEINGERASNYLRLFLTLIFTAGTVMGYLMKNQVSQILGNYVLGVIIYVVATMTSVVILKQNAYKSSSKYITMGMELAGYSVVIFGFLRLDDINMLSIPINDIVLYAIYFLLIVESILRFSPRFTLITGLSCTFIFCLLGILVIRQGGDKAINPATPLTVILGTLFIFAVTVAATVGTLFVQRVVVKIKDSEEEAKSKTKHLENLIKQAQTTIKEINQVVENLNTIAEDSKNMSLQQLTVSESSIQIVNHFSNSIDLIATMAKEQEQNCFENTKSIAHLDRIVTQIDQESLNVADKGSQTMKLAEQGEKELNNSIQEIQNIHHSSTNVAKIVSVINSIASKTNLLALNASIEAARAGEEGKGFEVVASEVGKLADSSGKNAMQIKTLILEMMNAIQKGVKQIQGSSESVKNVIGMNKTITKDIKGINQIVNSQIGIVKETNQRTARIQDMALKMKEVTENEKSNSIELKSNIEKVFSHSQGMATQVTTLKSTLEALIETSKKLKGEIDHSLSYS